MIFCLSRNFVATIEATVGLTIYVSGVEDVCTTMDGSDQSYKLLGDFGAGKALYRLSSHGDAKELHIEYLPQRWEVSTLNPELIPPPPVTVKVPVLRASEEDLYSLN